MTTSAQEQPLAYEPGDYFDEAVDPNGRPRPGYRDVLGALADVDPAELSARVDAAICRMGATFGEDDSSLFTVCPVPRLIQASEWARVERGLAQRARALNLFIRDIYGDREIVRAGVIGQHVIAGGDHF